MYIIVLVVIVDVSYYLCFIFFICHGDTRIIPVLTPSFPTRPSPYLFAEDAEAVARAAGLYEGGRKPIYIGHSFGGGQVFFAAASHPERMAAAILVDRSEEHTSELQSLMRISYAVFCLKKKQPKRHITMLSHNYKQNIKKV